MIRWASPRSCVSESARGPEPTGPDRRFTKDVAPANDVVGLAPVDPLVNTGDHHRRGHHDRRPDFTAVVDDYQPVELRFFGGFSVEETAEALGVSVRTVINDWNTARAWLRHELTARDAG